MSACLRHPETRVVLCLVALLGVSEAGIRFLGVRLSKDIRHLEQFEMLAERISAPPEGKETRVLFLGNSLTRLGVDVKVFQQTAAERNLGPFRVERIMPDNTALADWYYAWRSFFAAEGRAPDLLIVGFQGGHLRDAPSHHPARLARYYCRLEDLPELCAYDLTTFEDRAQFGAASLSALLCNRDRIESRVLDRLIPGYQAGIQELNRRVTPTAVADPSRSPTYHRLREFLSQTRAQGVRVVFAAMPVPEPYEIDAELPEIVREFGATLVDCRQVPGIREDMFPDGLHMNSQAAELYTRYLTNQLAFPPLFARLSSPTQPPQ